MSWVLRRIISATSHVSHGLALAALVLSFIRAQSSAPVAAYSFSEGTNTTTADASGNGNRGTLINGPAWMTPGRYGHGLQFDGTDDKVQVAPNASMDLTTALTIESWVYPTASNMSWKIVQRNGSSGALAYAFSLTNGTRRPTLWLTTSTSAYALVSDVSVPLNTWTHLAVTWDGATVRFYMNGIQFHVRTATGTLIAATSSQPLVIGYNPGEAFTGQIDEVRIYNRALAPGEVALDRDTAIDPVDPLGVAQYTPNPGAQGIAPTATIRATFTRPIDPLTMTPDDFFLTGPSGIVGATVAYDSATDTATLTPTAPMSLLTTYTAHLTSAIAGLNEEGSFAEVSWSFTTSPNPALAHAAYGFSEGASTTALDSSGNGNAGALVNDPTWTTSGRYGNALVFDGTDDRVDVPAASSLDLTIAFTFEAWVYPTTSNMTWKILQRNAIGSNGVAIGYSFGLASGSRRPGLYFTTSAATYNMVSDIAVPLNAWTHVAATWDGTTVRFYQSGLQTDVRTAGGTILASASFQPLTIGYNPGEAYAGRLDEVRVYGRALTAGEVAADRDLAVNQSDPPAVGQAMPTANSKGNPPTTAATATFTKPIDAASLTNATFYLTGPAGGVPATLAYNSATHIATLTPSTPLNLLTTYTAHVTTNITDQAGVHLSAGATWDFLTGPDPALPHAAYGFSEASGTTASDSSGNGNTATLTSASLWTTNGKYGTGLLLGGGNNGAQAPASVSLNVSSGLTLEAWINPSSIANYPKVMWRDGVGGSPYNLGMAWGNGSIGLTIGTTNGNFSVFAYTAIAANVWTHVAATYDGSLMRIYINGQLLNSASASGTILSSVGDLWLGRAPWGEGFSGRLDEVRVYNRALTAAEVAADMNSSIDDVTPPAVTSTSPATSSSNVAVDANVTATFSEDLAATSVTTSTFELRDVSNNLVAASVTYAPATHTITLDPAASLPGSSTFTAKVKGGSGGITDASGNPLAGDYTWSFTTIDTTPPTVTSVTPPSATRYVALNTTLQITFSEPIDANSITTGTVQLKDTRNAVVSGTVRYDAPTNSATFTPSSPLLPTRTYMATVIGGASGVKDLAGNALAANYVSTFITTVTPQRISAGETHGVAVDDSGQVWTWGSNSSGQLGRSTDSRIPGAVPGAIGVISVAAGGFHTLALKSNGTVLSWGYNFYGQLGIDGQTNSPPNTVVGLSNVIAVAAGRYNSVALKSDGTVWTWGYADQIGDGQGLQRTSPVQVPSLTGVLAIAAGDYHVMALKADGSVWTWGNNFYGALGNNTTTTQLSPVQAVVSPGVPLSGVVGIAGGDYHSLAIDGSDLSLRAWGYNGSGQIGDNTTTQRLTPVAVSTLANVRDVDGGNQRSVAALLDGSVYVWGSNVDQFGSNSKVPVGALGNPTGVQVSSGNGHNIAVTSAGTVWTWGDQNGSGQQGDGTTVPHASALTISEDHYAWKVGAPIFSFNGGTYFQSLTVNVTTATAGATIHYTTNGADPTDGDSAVPSNGNVSVTQTLTLKARAWKAGSPASPITAAPYTLKVTQPSFSPGTGTYTSPTTITIASTTTGATIRYTTDGSTPTASSLVYTGPITVGTTSTVQAFATLAGWSDSFVSSSTYTMNFGTLTAPTMSPSPGTYDGQVSVTLAAQPQSIIRYTTDGSIVSAFSPIYAKPLNITQTTTIRAKAFRTDYTASAETTGTYTVVATAPSISRASGTYAPGTPVTITDSDPTVTIRVTFNGADPTSTDGSVPSGTTLLVGGFTLKARAFKTGTNNSAVVSATYTLTEPFGPGALAAGGSHTLVTTPDGLLYAWGESSSGQLGYGGTSQKRVPTVATTLTGVTSIAGGASHTLAATWDGRLFAWGSNGYLQLGDGGGSNRLTPYEITSLTGVVAVAAGNTHSLALTADGHVYSWGTGAQLGLGSTNTASVPTLISGLSNVVAIAAGGFHSLAVTSSGQLYAWGNNSYAQLGDGGSSSHTTPELISGISNVVAVAAGGTHSMARAHSGAVYSWGDNSSGQLGLGNQSSRTTPTVIPGLTAIDIVAGGSHSMAVRNDGVLLAWGANNAGQVGVGSVGGVRTSPVPVSGISQVALLAAGGTYSAAATLSGHISAWGLDDSGQLGDGGFSNRSTPFEVLVAPGTWGSTPSPSLSIAPGTYNTIQTVVVSNALGSVADMHYTTSGADPTQSDPAVADGASLAIDQTVTFKLRSWVAGRAPSKVVTAAYVLQPDVPSTSPGTATYTSAQNVSITSTTGNTVVRYTVDGTDPTTASTLYGGPIGVNTFTVLKAKAFRNGWTPSATATTTLTFNYGTLTAPIADPLAGMYASGQYVSLTAQSGAQVRYTLDGSDPDASSTPYVGPFQLPDGFVTLKARAFEVDWTTSAATTLSYTMTNDNTPPTITAGFSPAPNASGWNNGDVTVTFTCSDESGVSVCTSPTTVRGEGVGIPVTGAATDVWGNHAANTWNVNIDRAPPSVHVYAPAEGSTVASGTTFVTIRGGAAELSGLESVSCDGVAATVTGNLFTCTSSVVAGVNTVTIEAHDLAGNSASTGLTFTVGDTVISRLEISPGTMTMFAGDTREVVVQDQNGNELHDGVWTVSDSSIAEVLEADTATTVTAIAAGETTLSVASHGYTAHATVTVFAAGSTLPSGTTLWSLNDVSGLGAPKRGEVLRAASTTADMDPSRAPALLFVDEGTEWEGNTLVRRNDRPTRIRTTTADGRQLSDVSFGGRIPQQIAADNSGGFIVVLPYGGNGLPSTIQRFDGRKGSITWEYIAVGGFFSDAAIHLDGTIYVSEFHITGTSYLIALAPDGHIGKSPLPHGHFRRIDTGDCGFDQEVDTPAYASHPIIREDGSVVLLTHESASYERVYSYHTDEFGHCGQQTLVFTSTQRAHVVEVTAAGEFSEHVLDTTVVDIPSQNLDAFRLMPDGHDGLLLAKRDYPTVYRISAGYEVVAKNLAILANDGSTRYEAEYVLGEDGAYAVVNSFRVTTVPGQPVTYAYESKAVQFDAQTLQKISDQALGIPMPDPQHVRLKFALAGGGVYASGPTTAYVVNPTVDTAGFAAGGNASPIAGEAWGGLSATPALATGASVLLAQTLWPGSVGTLLGMDNVSFDPHFGIFAKGHSINFIAGHHASLRIVPRNGGLWHAQYPNIFQRQDADGHYFLTIGAGPPPPNDTTISCDSFPLVSDYYRNGDMTEPPTSLERLRYRPANEDELILKLLQLDFNYRDGLQYCWNPNGSTTFNSNSYAAGLLKAASVPLPLFPEIPLSFYVGWTKPVPTSQFDPP